MAMLAFRCGVILFSFASKKCQSSPLWLSFEYESNFSDKTKSRTFCGWQIGARILFTLDQPDKKINPV
jgi:hypothetical protein